MLFNDAYQTILAKSEGVVRDKGSKFIAYAYPFKDETKLKEILETLKNEHPKARHYCFAYRLTPDRSIFRINDDGEPSGTAGRPILNVLLSKSPFSGYSSFSPFIIVTFSLALKRAIF